jgi:ribonuclease-3
MKLQRLEAALGHDFARPELLRQALTHRSFGSPNNEQLEFLGDSVLDCAISGAPVPALPRSA